MLLALCLSLAAFADSPRQRLPLDAGWCFQIEKEIVPPSGANTVALTEWIMKESANGQADAPAFTARDLDTSTGWEPVRTGDDITAAYQDKFVWFRTALDPVLAAHPLKGPRSVYFHGAGQRAVVYLNGRRIVEHTDNVRTLNASEVLQTGRATEAANGGAQEIDGINQSFEACIEPYLDPNGPNILTVMIRASAKDLTNGLRGDVRIYGGFPPETQADFDDSSWRKVHLPHDYVVEGTFDLRYNNQRAALPLPRAFYRRSLDIPATYAGRRLRLDFDGIYRDSRVWLNGRYLGHHPSGYTGSSYDITDFVTVGGRNTLVVMVDPRVAEGWWYEGGGIYRHVWLTVADPLHVAPHGTHVIPVVNDVTTDRPSATVTIKTSVVNKAAAEQNATLVSTVIDPGGEEIARIETGFVIPAGQEREITQDASIARARLWSLETPHLYRVETRILRDLTVADTQTTTFGLRTIRFDVDRGFFLNEKPVKIHGTCNHHDFAGVGIAMPDNLQEWRVRKLQEMGANAWRCSHSVPSAEFLDACDRLGVLVMDENRHLASSVDRKTGNGAGYVADEFSELDFMLRRDRNHPSVFLWCLANEEKNTGANSALLRILMERTRQLDATRPTTAALIFARGKGMDTVADVCGMNYSHRTYDEARKNLPLKPLLATEIGSARADRGIYYDYPPSEDPKKNPPYHVRNYSTWFAFGDPEANENISHWKPIADREWIAGGFYWTGFDYKGEPSPSQWPAISSHFGIFDLCGFPKDNYHYYKAWWTKQPVIHVMPHWNWVGQKEGQPMRVVVFSNAAQIELLLNGQSLGSKTMPANESVEWQVPYAPGKLEARGTMADGKVITDLVETTGKPAALRLRTDLTTLRANQQDIAVAEVSVVDEQGRVVPTAGDFVSFTLAGPGNLAGVGNGDPASHEPDVANQRSAFNGHCAALIRAGKTPGNLTLTATAPGLSPATMEVQVAP